MVSVTDPAKLEHLQTREQMKLLDVIDALRAEGLSEYTALPQLIVCGDQSSGKSSVLEAICGVPFPRKDTFCTRFATEVILRRATDEFISVSLVPGKTRSSQDRDILSGFHHDLSSREEFPELFEKAKHAMGLDVLGSRAFSEDILRVEVSGPTQPQLTVVDLPGLIHSENRKQTARDVSLVHKLVESYMKSERSIILAVVSAMNEFANQIVLKKARDVDPEGERTIGIITKPDTLRIGTTLEREFIALARNEDVKFERGWHVVKNLDLGAGEGETKDRDSEESLFFEKSNFKSLPPSSVGISSLRHRLSQVLFDQVRSELPKLVEDIRSGIATTRDGLDKLGPSRVTPEEQRAFLIRVSQEFQILSKDAINGQYSNPFFKDYVPAKTRLCAVIANSHDRFGTSLRESGARWIISESKDRKSVRGSSSSSKYRTREEAINKIQKLLRISRGRELPGLVNPLLVGEVFREYSEPWEGIARSHIRSVWKSTKFFLQQVLQHLTDAEVCAALFYELLEPIMNEKLDLAHSKLAELIAVYKDHPTTLNHCFQENVVALQKARRNSSNEEKLRGILSQGSKVHEQDLPLLMSAMQFEETPDMNRKAAEEIFDNMNAFYKTAMEVFLDNVPSLVIQETIVNQVPRMLCPESVFAMESDLVKKIASESEAKRLQREELTRKLGTLEAGYGICKQCVARGSSGLKEQIILRDKAPAEELASDEDISSGSDEVVEVTQSETEEPSDTHMPVASPREDVPKQEAEPTAGSWLSRSKGKDKHMKAEVGLVESSTEELTDD
ncbi:hypothetical protein OEA41_006574 [Lepraria neglecta]|uniref:Uncharacterized protein n=1 Tax=Lepraria neglecta TaxID=209136 RepID=A0AAE0DL26_9LECA|nr:hypothetical protein OEA41_006574 [Lepraria neglecta]